MQLRPATAARWLSLAISDACTHSRSIPNSPWLEPHGWTRAAARMQL
jgi:hypothetical protein